MFNAADAAFIEGLGCSTQELFDFVDDSQGYGGDPDYETSLAVTAIRRDYFLNVLGGKSTGRTATMASLPAKSAEVDGISWLPRLIVKARLKLRGEMPADLMYGCAGDRPFLRRMTTTLPQFLELVRDSGDDDHRNSHRPNRDERALAHVAPRGCNARAFKPCSRMSACIAIKRSGSSALTR